MEEVLLKGMGVWGAIIVALGIYIIFKEKQHKKERDEWRAADDKKFDRLNKIADDTNDTLTGVNNVLTGIKTLLETRNHR